MAQNYPDWFMLIEHWVVRNGIGYTLPFLVGARAVHHGKTIATRDDARALLDEIFNHPIENRMIELTWCANLDAPVFGLKRESYPGREFSSAITNQPSIFVRDDIIRKWGNTVDELMINLLNYAESPIIEGKFSCNGGIWTPFDDTERFRIENILSER